MGRQDSPTPSEADPVKPRRPERIPTSGLLLEVTVLQHCAEPVLHWLMLIGVTVGGA